LNAEPKTEKLSARGCVARMNPAEMQFVSWIKAPFQLKLVLVHNTVLYAFYLELARLRSAGLPTSLAVLGSGLALPAKPGCGSPFGREVQNRKKPWS